MVQNVAASKPRRIRCIERIVGNIRIEINAIIVTEWHERSLGKAIFKILQYLFIRSDRPISAIHG